ncbi:uncharacterized protein C7orf31 [Myxocyprinus asiaticus]|uniref:uncharacterized protein C7orf31 n=1 Tax=Myxocyprinus asiaticus TaxID=70543 RepID=UPI002223A427|nr:uncharacterized protein C7orf31 [Myxocyprinus asiaticus]
MASSSQIESVPAVTKGHQHFSYGGSVLPESVIIEQYYDLTPTKKSNLRMNDQLEKMIKVAVPREHPYQSHMSRYAMFPSYRSPDDPDTGVRAGSKLPLNPLLPSSAPTVTLLHKTTGSPYHHEILDVPIATRRKAMTWSGQHDFQNHTKPLKEKAQVFYPRPPKTVCPNASLRDWNTTLSECTANMLRNLEKAQWLTSYQLHYTGTGPTNPIKLDDFHEKTIAMFTGEMNPLTAQLRERSFPIFTPSRPLEGRKARILPNLCPLKSTYAPSLSSPATSVLSGAADLGLTAPGTLTPLAVEVRRDDTSLPQRSTETQHTDQYRSVDADLKEVLENSNTGHILEHTFHSLLDGKEKLQTMKSQPEKGNEYLSKSLQPRSFQERKQTLDNRTQSTLLELQDSFSKSEAHRQFRESLKGSVVDLRDNYYNGRKHLFCGSNSYYFHN